MRGAARGQSGITAQRGREARSRELVRDARAKGNAAGSLARFGGAAAVLASAPSRAPAADPRHVQTAISLPLLHRIADALERLAPAARRGQRPRTAPTPSSGTPTASGWSRCTRSTASPIDLLRGIDRVRDILLDNTERFAAGLPANNVLLWGARGTGKSALVKAAHAAVNGKQPGALALIEIHREDIPSLPRLLSLVRATNGDACCSATICRSTRTTPATSR